MSYNTVSEFKLFAFPSGSYNSIPTTVIQHYLDEAASEIDASLAKHHSLPMNTGSYGHSSRLAMLYNAERIITSYNLLCWKGFKPNVNSDQDVVLVNAYNGIVGEGGLLSKLLSGEIILPNDSDATPSTSENVPKIIGKPITLTKYLDDDGKEFIRF